MKILIICPKISEIGGVPAFFYSLKRFLVEKAAFLEIGARRNNESFLFKPLNLLFDCLKLNKLLKQSASKYGLVNINPSFGYLSIIRDALLLKIAKNYEKPCVVFFHGIDARIVKIVETFIPQIFFSCYNIADGFIVLSKEFKKRLRKFGFKQPIFVETSLIDDQLVQGFSLYERINKIRKKKINLLFLARIEKSKGIFETIKAMGLLSKKHSNLHLIVAGDGKEMKKARNLTSKLHLNNEVTFLGTVKGLKKRKTFEHSDIYILPTYREGMPISILEALAFGLPVITRPVGRLKEFIVDGEHGYLVQSKDPIAIAHHIEKIILNPGLRLKMSISAYKLANEKVLASNVAKRLQNIYNLVIKRAIRN